MIAGSIRVIHIRTLPEDTQGESVIRVDRSHPVLGNRHILKSKLDKQERARVIATYKADLDADMAAGGPMSRAVMAIAERVMVGESIALACHCFPLPCHADVIVAAVHRILQSDPVKRLER